MAVRYSVSPYAEANAQMWQSRMLAALLTIMMLLLALWVLLTERQIAGDPEREVAPLLVELIEWPPPPVVPEVLEMPVPKARPRVAAGGQPAPRSPPERTPPQADAAGARPAQTFNATGTAVAPVPLAPATVAPLLLPLPASLPAPNFGAGSASVGASSGAGRSGELGTGGAGAGGRGRGTGNGDGDGAGGGNRLTLASWVRQPTESELARFVPDAAKAAGTSGRAVIACRVRASTAVYNCRIVSEQPGGVGLGRASLAASRIFRVHPPRHNGRIVRDAWVVVPIDWVYQP